MMTWNNRRRWQITHDGSTRSVWGAIRTRNAAMDDVTAAGEHDLLTRGRRTATAEFAEVLVNGDTCVEPDTGLTWLVVDVRPHVEYRRLGCVVDLGDPEDVEVA